MSNRRHFENPISLAPGPMVIPADKEVTELESGGDDNPVVSIICMTFNQVGYIADALNGFLSQVTDFEYEILLHDDCSTDGTADICKEYASNNPFRIRYFHEDENQYSQGKRFGMIYLARGKYVAICEGDDYWIDTHKLQKQYDFMEAHSDCSLYAHNARVYDCRINKYVNNFNDAQTGYMNINDLIMHWGMPTASFFYRKEDMLKKPESYSVCITGDEVAKLHLATCGRVYYSNETMSVYRRAAKGSWSQRVANGKDSRKLQKRYTQSFLLFLDAFNRETSGAYEEAVTRRKNRIWINYYLECCDYRSIRDDSILNNEYKVLFEEMPTEKKVWHRLREFMSGLHMGLFRVSSFPYVHVSRI